MGLTGKTLSQQAALVRDRADHISNSISKSGDTFGRLANESEEHKLKEIAKRMEDDISVEAILWKISARRAAIKRQG